MSVIVIEDWMVERMKLSGTELLAFALIHGCTQEGDGCWHGGYENMGRRIGATQRAAVGVVNKLIEKGFVDKGTGTIRRKSKSILTSTVSNENFSCEKISCENFSLQRETESLFSDLSEINKSINKTLKKEKVEKERKITLPFSSAEFTQAWDELMTQPKWRKKTDSALQKSLNKLAKFPENVAIEAINNSISGDYQGIFPEKIGRAITTLQDNDRLNPNSKWK